MVKKLAIGLGSAVLVFLIVFCLVPTKAVSYTATEQYQDVETYYIREPYTAYLPVHTLYRPATRYEVANHREVIEVTKYRDVPTQTAVWKTREVTLHKNVSMLEYLLSY